MLSLARAVEAVVDDPGVGAQLHGRDGAAVAAAAITSQTPNTIQQRFRDMGRLLKQAGWGRGRDTQFSQYTTRV